MANPIAVPGTVVPTGSLATPGGAQGVQGIQGPTSISADAGNIATLGSDNLILVPQSSLWSMRLRSFNAIGNPTFEVDQRNAGNTVASAGGATPIVDRWNLMRSGASVLSAGQNSVAAAINLPGTNFALTRSFFRVTLTTQDTAPAATAYIAIQQQIEGIGWRELQNDVHSLQLLVRSSVANLKIGATVQDPTSANCLTNLLTLGAANTWTLLQLPNLPLWPAGTFVNTPGNIGYALRICLLAGTTYTTPANGTWQSGSFIGAVGQSNFAASPVNSTFDIAYISHEPGNICSTPQDCQFTTNYDACLRYFCKSWPYTTAIGTTNYSFAIPYVTAQPTQAFGSCVWPKRMAKTPTVTYYGPNNGTANNAFNATAGGAVTGITATSPGETAANQLAGTSFTIPQVLLVHYTSDTGW